AALRVVGPKEYEPPGIAIWQRANHDRVDDAEDRRRRADAESECDDGDRGEARRPPETADGVPHVVPERIDNRFPTAGAHACLGRLDAADLDDRGASRGFERHATPHLLVGELVEVVAQLFVELLLDGFL